MSRDSTYRKMQTESRRWWEPDVRYYEEWA